MDKMDSPISSGRPAERNRRLGFTLVEVLIGATLSSFVLAGVLSAFLMMGRMGANIQNYTEIESKARQSLELFSREVRLAYSIAGTTLDSSTVTLNIPDTTSNRTGTGSGAYTVTYTYDAVNSQLTRAVNSGTAVPFITGIQLIPGSTAFFKYYRLLNPENFEMGKGYLFNSAVATIPREARQIEISFVLQRKSVTVATASNKVLSARFILRNK
jgi:Tfp pilus assembly protein PilW